MFNGKRILITGGTGSLGTAFTKYLLTTDVYNLRILSRGEQKQVQMKSELKDPRLRFLIGDVRDKERLARSLEDVDIVIHAAALKHVPVAEYNPFEAVKTNVDGAQNLIEACLDGGVETVLAVGTDKAVAPLSTYGATKMLMERLFIAANHYKGKRKVKFLCVRYGNVLGSGGSIVPILFNQIQSGKKITITDPDMTRFTITMKEALELSLRTLQNGEGGQVFIPKLKAYKTGDIKDAIVELTNSKVSTERIPIRPGEKYHESLIIKDEVRNTFESDKDYVVFDKQMENSDLKSKHYKKTSLTDGYSSDKVELFTKEELKEILIKENLVPSQFISHKQ